MAKKIPYVALSQIRGLRSPDYKTGAEHVLEAGQTIDLDPSDAEVARLIAGGALSAVVVEEAPEAPEAPEGDDSQPE